MRSLATEYEAFRSRFHPHEPWMNRAPSSTPPIQMQDDGCPRTAEKKDGNTIFHSDRTVAVASVPLQLVLLFSPFSFDLMCILSRLLCVNHFVLHWLCLEWDSSHSFQPLANRSKLSSSHTLSFYSKYHWDDASSQSQTKLKHSSQCLWGVMMWVWRVCEWSDGVWRNVFIFKFV